MEDFCLQMTSLVLVSVLCGVPREGARPLLFTRPSSPTTCGVPPQSRAHFVGGPSFLWWHTIIAPSAVMDQIDKVWHILEAKPSWSLRNSLSTSRDQRRRPAPPISKSQDNFPPTNLRLPSAPSVSSLLPPALILLTLFCPLSLPRPLPPPLPSQPYPKGPMPNRQPQSTPL